MTDFTKANPFEFEGIHVWREGGDVRTHYEPRECTLVQFVAQADARAAHALIEAENNEWHEDGSGFRKGSWFVVGDPSYLYVSHKDLPVEAWGCHKLDDWDRGTPDAVRAIAASFNTWHAANYPKQPSEPTGLGAVVRVDGTLITRASISGGDFPWVSTVGVRYRWEEIAGGGPVTVLSEGVTK